MRVQTQHVIFYTYAGHDVTYCTYVRHYMTFHTITRQCATFCSYDRQYVTLFVLPFPRNRKLTNSTGHSFPTRVDCEKPTTQHETFLRVFVNVKEYQSKLSSVLSTGGNHAKSDEHWRDSTFFDRRLICDETRGFCKTHSFSVFEGSIYDRYIGCNFTRLLTTNFTRLFSSLFL